MVKTFGNHLRNGGNNKRTHGGQPCQKKRTGFEGSNEQINKRLCEGRGFKKGPKSRLGRSNRKQRRQQAGTGEVEEKSKEKAPSGAPGGQAQYEFKREKLGGVYTTGWNGSTGVTVKNGLRENGFFWVDDKEFLYVKKIRAAHPRGGHLQRKKTFSIRQEPETTPFVSYRGRKISTRQSVVGEKKKKKGRQVARGGNTTQKRQDLGRRETDIKASTRKGDQLAKET